MTFQNKVVIVTGATSGIGAATAKMFAAEGAKVIMVGRDKEKGEKIVQQIIQAGSIEPDLLCCDVSDWKNVRKLRETVAQSYDKIDVLFNNAGIYITSDLEGLDFDDWERTFRVNVDGVLYMTKFFLDLLIPAHGNIINNASVGGMESFTSGSKTYMYAASKSAVIKFSKLCALNYAKDIRVNVICPGIIDTEIYTNRDFSRFDGAIPMGYIAEPERVAEVVSFLASDKASYVTGAVLPIDGGMSLM